MDTKALTAATEMLAAQLATTTQEVQDLKRSGLQDALSGWYLTREEYEALDEVRKNIGKLLEEMSRTALPEMMRENKTKTITLENLRRRFTVSQRYSCSMLDKEKGALWLRETGNAAIITETVNASTLSAFAKKRITEEGLEMPEDIFKVSIMDLISATKV